MRNEGNVYLKRGDSAATATKRPLPATMPYATLFHVGSDPTPEMKGVVLRDQCKSVKKSADQRGGDLVVRTKVYAHETDGIKSVLFL